ncbi:hypothetical protein AL515_06045 [Citrobacter sp. FDAARGOS_156]|uniref:hypothetical protein n=1 Tax=Citrobacter sp. FDAARGOS_156 TaxID=1702170 RepID=UPI00076B62AC|nr:hypothetical protein [Citrobacter sp. FDAARGOS_156]AMH13440.1 hypothetical protein AL515_06045 [Citrobacter sp. FDAARGOS_156]
MKCQNANNYFFYTLTISSLFFSIMAYANIEKTVIANYDLNTEKSAHYQLILSPLHQDTDLTLIPLEQNNQAPSIFEISTCLNRSAGPSKQGELHFSDAKADKNDLRLSNFSSFIVEHNLHTWWIHLNPQQNLLFTQDVGGLLVTDPSEFTFSTKACQTN